MKFSGREKVLLIVLIAIIVVLSYLFINEMVLKSFDPPEGYELISNENGVYLYKDPKTNVFIEVKKANNPTTTHHSNCAGKKANVTVKFEKYTITAYKEVASNPIVPAVQIYNSGAAETLSTFEIQKMLGKNHLNSIDNGIVNMYDWVLIIFTTIPLTFRIITLNMRIFYEYDEILEK